MTTPPPPPSRSLIISYTLLYVVARVHQVAKGNGESKTKGEGGRGGDEALSAALISARALSLLAALWLKRNRKKRKQHFRQEVSIIQKCNIIMCLHGPVYQTAFSGRMWWD